MYITTPFFFLRKTACHPHRLHCGTNLNSMRGSFLPPLAAGGTGRCGVCGSCRSCGRLSRRKRRCGARLEREEMRERRVHHTSHRPQDWAEILTEYLDKRVLRRVNGISTRIVGMVLDTFWLKKNIIRVVTSTPPTPPNLFTRSARSIR